MKLKRTFLLWFYILAGIVLGAMLAAVGCGEYPDVETAAAKIVKVIDTVEPEPGLVAKYEERYQKFKRIYPTVKDLYQG